MTSFSKNRIDQYFANEYEFVRTNAVKISDILTKFDLGVANGYE